MISCSVILCTLNPEASKLDRVFDALRRQTLASDKWEFIVVDNASASPLADRIDLSWHLAARCLVEPRPGHLPARLCGGAAATSSLLVFIDDDNVLREDYLEQALHLSARHPKLGVWSGQSHPEFEVPPPEWSRPWWGMLAIWEFEEDTVTPVWNPFSRLPFGAGMCVRRAVMESYARSWEESPLRHLLGRQGGSCMSADDEDIALHAYVQGWGTGSFTSLHLTHLISASRLRPEYLLRLTTGMAASSVVLQHLYPHFVYARPSRIPHALRVLRHILRVPGWERDRRLAQLRGEHLGKLKVREYRLPVRAHLKPSEQPMAEIIIEAGRSDKHYWTDLWHYRELFGFLAWRDILVRYKQTAIGLAWAVLRPLLTIFIGAGIFGGLAGLPSDGVPYAIMVCAGTLPWYFFSSALSESSSSLVGNANLISKIYFPRMILPASAVVVAFVDFAISLAILAALMLWYGVLPTWRLLTLPVFILIGCVSAMGPGLLFTALNVKYRDFRYIIPFMVQFGLYVSPVFYSSSAIEEKWGVAGRAWASLNPIVGVIDGFRWAILGTTQIHWPSFLVSCGIALALFILGIWYFRHTERTLADVI